MLVLIWAEMIADGPDNFEHKTAVAVACNFFYPHSLHLIFIFIIPCYCSHCVKYHTNRGYMFFSSQIAVYIEIIKKGTFKNIDVQLFVTEGNVTL